MARGELVPAVGILIGSRRIGGTESQVSHLIDGLTARGIATVLFLGDDRGGRGRHHIAVPVNETVPIYDLRAGRGVRWRLDKGLKLALLLRRHQLNVLHMFNLGSIELGRLALLLSARVAGIASVRGVRFAEDGRTRDRLVRAVGGVLLSCNSEAVANQLLRLEGVSPERLVVIRNGIPLPNGDCLGSSREVPSVLFAGHLNEVKDPLTFVRAVLLASSRVQFKVIVAGDGPLTEAVERLLASSLPANRWQMLGRVAPDRVPYRDVDLVVSSSLREGGSNTLLEAMAHGVPVVATDAYANRTMVSESGAGITVPVGDADGMAAAMAGLLADRNRMRLLGMAGRSYVERQYGLERMVDEHLAMYKKVLGGAIGRRGEVTGRQAP